MQFARFHFSRNAKVFFIVGSLKYAKYFTVYEILQNLFYFTGYL